MKNNHKKTAAIILAAGSGTRMGTDKTKQMLKINGKSVLKHTLLAFEASKSISEIVVVCRDGEQNFVNNELQNIDKCSAVVIGGKCRAESASLGFYQISDDVEYIMIHDAARCLITPYEIDLIAEAVYEHKAATASVAVSDTLKRCNGQMIIETVTRKDLRAVQTPQAFERQLYSCALASVEVLDETITDDNMLVESLGVAPYCVETLPSNIKITTSYDLELAEFILMKRKGAL